MTKDNLRLKEHPILIKKRDEDKKEKLIKFFFDGEELYAKEGEMIASALFANNINVFGHHHRDNSPGCHCSYNCTPTTPLLSQSTIPAIVIGCGDECC